VTAIAVYVSLGVVVNLLSWDRFDDRFLTARLPVQSLYLIGSFLVWPIFFAARVGRFLRKRFTEDSFKGKL
jgi:hypothetical protein